MSEIVLAVCTGVVVACCIILAACIKELVEQIGTVTTLVADVTREADQIHSEVKDVNKTADEAMKVAIRANNGSIVKTAEAIYELKKTLENHPEATE